ncbi:MAG: GNAT family N-acetyltransferase [Nostoc sp. DedQUE08]|uniref:GNAT family N-acetyltransferase n=1 Tax=unclassified Nostoc TaxID=2593658 RepID=UPI002AD36833|nr:MULTISPECIES: GNAT family N-acetyltransferase [unclassified Nostoc]MDZ8068073.1 GNAT family N-acetyltransferase [Nostoc sp. DedQUE08]MDZ8128989.1 GNAT family N-acetyltransferase [Nostoc sp. DedQUE07]
MNYKIQDNCIISTINQIFDKEGLEYYLKVYHFYDEQQEYQSIQLHLSRCKRKIRIGHAYCTFNSQEDMVLSDIIISNESKFLSLSDKLFQLTHWNEPTDYRRKGLGTYLLKYIVDLAKSKKVKKIHGCLTFKDIDANPNLIHWYQKHGFKLESPIPEEIEHYKYQVRLNLE